MAFGRLERSKAAEPMSQINMTPLVDVMLVLVVIFIITAPLMTASLKVELPQTSAAQPASVPQFISLSIDREQRVALGDKPVTPDELLHLLAQTAQNAPQTEVQLRADKTVPYGKIVEVMGMAHKAGLTRIGFVADPADAKAAH
jgi:biopolymer transport protein TolR